VPDLLAVYGSPRKGGNTSTILDYFLGGVEGAVDSPGADGFRIERVHLRDLSISHCTECGGCAKTGVCVIRDDMSGYYDKLLSFERIVMAFPVFFLGPPAIVKAFIDRAQSLWVRKYVLGIKPERSPDGGAERKGYLLSAGGFKGSARVFDCNRSIVKAFFMSCGFKYGGELLVPGVDGFGEVKNVENIAEKAREAGRSFAV
jgi:multimeric flavodoxin WrbA